MEIKTIQSVWAEHSDHLAKESTGLDIASVNQRMAALVCPGPFYHYIIDFQQIRFDSISDSYAEIIGGDGEIPSVDTFIQKIHPDEVAHFSRCEQVAGKFLFEFLEPEKILDYKVSYCFRLKVADGTYRMFLHQAMGLTLDDNLGLGKVLGVHTDISSITQVNNHQISFFHLGDGPSYTNIPVNADPDFSFGENTSGPVSSREIQVLRLISEGSIARDIGDTLNISEATVRKHRENLLRKTNSNNTAQLVAHAIRSGLI